MILADAREPEPCAGCGACNPSERRMSVQAKVQGLARVLERLAVAERMFKRSIEFTAFRNAAAMLADEARRLESDTWPTSDDAGSWGLLGEAAAAELLATFDDILAGVSVTEPEAP